MLFPRFFATFFSDLSLEEMLSIISNFVKESNNGMKIINVRYSKKQNILLSAKTGSYIYYNAFLPIIEISIEPNNSKSQISITFSLHNGTKAVICLVYSVMLILLMIAVFLMFFQGLNPLFFLLLWFGYVAVSYTMYNVGLLFCSRKYLKRLYKLLSHDNEADIPLLSKIKG